MELGVIAVASAKRERDREQWPMGLLLSVVTATGLVSAFAVWPCASRERLTLQNQVLLAHTRQQADERLQAASKAATLGTLAMGVAHESRPLSGDLLARRTTRREVGRGERRVWRLRQLSSNASASLRSSGFAGTRSCGTPAPRDRSATLVEASIVMSRTGLHSLACPSDKSTCRHPHDHRRIPGCSSKP